MKRLLTITAIFVYLVPNVWASCSGMVGMKPMVPIECEDLVPVCIGGEWQWMCVGRTD